MRVIWAELRRRPLLWLIPLAVLYGGLVWLAWIAVRTPSVPWTYRVDF